MKYTVHIQSVEIDEEERDHLRNVGFYEWFRNQAELKNIQYDYIEREEEV
jgi:hypothetical protein